MKNDFPILSNGKIAYLDNSATTQKPRAVIDAVQKYYETQNANPLRGAYRWSVEATQKIEDARKKIAKFINAKSASEIIFTKNATESLNLVAYSFGRENLNLGDEILISIAEHHSNLVPWQILAKSTGAILKYIRLDSHGNFLEPDINSKTKIVAVTQISNVLGIKNDLSKIIERAHESGAIVVVDGAQSVPHLKTDVQKLDCDFLAFSGHKMLAPMGIGVLYGRKKFLESMPPFLAGGEMIEYVEEQSTTFAELPHKFEAGTQNVGGAIGLSTAIDYLETIGFEKIESIEQDLLDYAIPKLRELKFIDLYGCDVENKIGIIAFNVKDVHPHDVATILDKNGVAIRAGDHCAQPLHRFLNLNSSCRASFYFYNTHEDIDRLIDALKNVRKVMRLE